MTRTELLFRRYVDALNARQLDVLSELVAGEVVHNGEAMTRETWWRTQIAMNVEAVPDLRWRIDELVVTDDRAFVRYTDSGTPVAAWFGFDPSGA